MPSTTTIALSTTSRYKDTPVYLQGGSPEFGLWEPPAEFVTLGTAYKRHRVKVNEVGFLDLIATKFYGAGNEKDAWIIAQANAIVVWDRDMYPGQVLYIPSQSSVLQFKARAGNASQSSG